MPDHLLARIPQPRISYGGIHRGFQINRFLDLRHRGDLYQQVWIIKGSQSSAAKCAYAILLPLVNGGALEGICAMKPPGSEQFGKLYSTFKIQLR